MKRDMEVIRQILLEIEATNKCIIDLGDDGKFQAPFLNRNDSILAKLQRSQADTNPELIEQTKSKIYNYGLLVREGWVEEAGDMAIKGLSWHAHDFLDTMRKDNHWNRIKGYVKEKGEDISELPLSTVKRIAEKILTELIMSV